MKPATPDVLNDESLAHAVLLGSSQNLIHGYMNTGLFMPARLLLEAPGPRPAPG